MSAFSPHAVIRKPDNLRVRSVPEWGCLLVYTPSTPNLHYLDAHSWLIFELCDGRERKQIFEDFVDNVPSDTPMDKAQSAFDDVVTTLLGNGVLETPQPAEVYSA
ncbi:hypothetical protein [Rhodococcus sp. IEGM1428]|uniref:hypothetical protein n=1 Tax=Rhodococcus sp. IEGM1428 TaxID=3392191 RepID=UPI003D0C76B9